MENFKQLDGQARLGIEPGTSCQPVLSTEPLSRVCSPTLCVCRLLMLTFYGCIDI